mgnify:CR=1 FL=1
MHRPNFEFSPLSSCYTYYLICFQLALRKALCPQQPLQKEQPGRHQRRPHQPHLHQSVKYASLLIPNLWVHTASRLLVMGNIEIRLLAAPLMRGDYQLIGLIEYRINRNCGNINIKCIAFSAPWYSLPAIRFLYCFVSMQMATLRAFLNLRL